MQSMWLHQSTKAQPLPAELTIFQCLHLEKLIRTGLAVVIAAVYKLDEAASSLSCRWSINLTGQCKLMKCTTFSKWNHWVLPCPVSHDKVTLDMEFKHPNFNQPISQCTCNGRTKFYKFAFISKRIQNHLIFITLPRSSSHRGLSSRCINHQRVKAKCFRGVLGSMTIS